MTSLSRAVLTKREWRVLPKLRSLRSLRCWKRETQSWKQNPLLFWSAAFEWNCCVLVSIGLLSNWVLKNKESLVGTRLVWRNIFWEFVQLSIFPNCTFLWTNFDFVNWLNCDVKTWRQGGWHYFFFTTFVPFHVLNQFLQKGNLSWKNFCECLKIWLRGIHILVMKNGGFHNVLFNFSIL